MGKLNPQQVDAKSLTHFDVKSEGGRKVEKSDYQAADAKRSWPRLQTKSASARLKEGVRRKDQVSGSKHLITFAG